MQCGCGELSRQMLGVLNVGCQVWGLSATNCQRNAMYGDSGARTAWHAMPLVLQRGRMLQGCTVEAGIVLPHPMSAVGNGGALSCSSLLVFNMICEGHNRLQHHKLTHDSYFIITSFSYISHMLQPVEVYHGQTSSRTS